MRKLDFEDLFELDDDLFFSIIIVGGSVFFAIAIGALF